MELRRKVGEAESGWWGGGWWDGSWRRAGRVAIVVRVVFCCREWVGGRERVKMAPYGEQARLTRISLAPTPTVLGEQGRKG